MFLSLNFIFFRIYPFVFIGFLFIYDVFKYIFFYRSNIAEWELSQDTTVRGYL